MPTKVQMQRVTRLMREVDSFERKLAAGDTRTPGLRELTDLVRRLLLEFKDLQIKVLQLRD